MSTPISCRVDNSMDELLDQLAKEKNTSKSELFKNAIGNYLQKELENGENSLTNNDDNTTKTTGQTNENTTKDLWKTGVNPGVIFAGIIGYLLLKKTNQ